MIILLLLLTTSLSASVAFDATRMTDTALRAAQQSHQQATWQHSAPLAPSLGIPFMQERMRSTTWQYWAMTLGGGGALVFTDDPVAGSSHSWVPDASIMLERSWYLTDQFTAMLDISFITPTIRLGYVISEQSRVSFGVGMWFYMFWGHRPFMVFALEEMRLRGGGVAVKELEDGPYKKSLDVTPSIAFDHFLSKNCFLRVTASYDQLYTMRDLHKIVVHWPQVSLSLSFKF